MIQGMKNNIFILSEIENLVIIMACNESYNPKNLDIFLRLFNGLY